MALINCKNCGGSIALSEDKTFGTCDFCGSTMTFPKLDDDQRAAAFNRGNHFRRIGEFDKALAVYERIVQENDQDAEAHWCCALCRFGIEYVEDPETFEWLPTCHRASFDSFLEDVDYLAAVEHSEGLTQRQYRKDAAKIAEVQRGILATSQNAEAYDVFICYKESDAEGQRTRDSLMAQDIYYQLTEQGKRVFFARITLEDVAGTQYEPYIFAALNSAKVMVVVGTKPEHFSAVWVKNEWSRFLAMMRKDRSKLLLPCYAGMDPYDLPEQLSVLQSYDMTKIGFIQDLIRGIGKVVDADKKPEAAPVAAAQPVVQPVIQQSNNVTALLKRGAMALEDGDWARADEFYEEVLNQDAECGEAYLGKFLAGQQCLTLEAVARKRIDTPRKAGTESFTVKPDMTGVEEFAQAHTVYGFLTKEQILKGFPSAMNITLTAPGWRKILEEEPTWWTGNKVLARAEKYGAPELRTQVDAAKKAVLDDLHRRLTNAEATDRTTEENARATLAQKTEDGRRVTKILHQTNRAKWDKRFKDLSEDLDRFNSVSGLTATIRSFELLGPDPAVRDKIAACNEKISALREEELARQEAAEKARRDAEAKKKKTTKLIAIITAIALVLLGITYLLCDKVIIPASNYKKAEALAAEGRYAEAAIPFGKAGAYSDARARSMELWDQSAVRDTVGAGDSHTVGLRADGTVVAVGENTFGQCNVSSWTDIVAIRAGYFHTVGLRADGTVVAVGWNEHGQCDVSGWTDIVAISAGFYHTVGLRADGTAVAVGWNEHGQCDVSGWTDIVAVSAGSYHTVGLRADGTAVAVGSNGSGRCDVSGWTDIVAVSAGGYHTVVLRADGTVVAVGSNPDGRCDVSGWTDIVTVSAGGSHTVGLRADGTVVAVGWNQYGQCDVSGWTDIVAISAGLSHTVGLRADGTVVAVGWNEYGQCDVSG